MLKEISFRKKLTVSFFIVFLVPITIAGILAMVWNLNNIKNNARQGYHAALNSTIEQIDQSFRILDNYSKQLILQDWVNSFIYMETNQSTIYDTYDIARFSYDLKVFTGTQDFAKEVFIYFPNNDTVISSLSRNLEDYNWFVEHIFSAEEFTGVLESNILDVQVLPLEEIKNYQSSLQGVVVSYPMSTAGEGCIICFFIPYQSISNVLVNNTEEDWLFFIRDEDNIFLNSEALSDINEELYKQLLDKDTHVVNLDNKYYEVIRSDSKYTEWEYIYLLPQDYVNTQNVIYIVTGIGILLGLGILGYLMSIVVADRNSRSVEMLIKKVMDSDLSDISSTKNEFEQIGNVIDNMLEKNQSMQQQFDDQRPALQEAYIKCLLEGIGGKKEENIYKSFSVLNIDLFNAYYMCLSVQLRQETLLEIEHILPADSKYRYIRKGDELVYIISFKTLSAYNMFYTTLQDQSPDLLNMVIGIGQPCESIADIYQSYQHAVLAREFAGINELNLVIYSEITSSNIEYYFPLEKETAIRNAIRAGDYKAVCTVLDELEEKNLFNQPVSPSKVRNLYQDLLLVCIKIIGELEAVDIITIDNNMADCFSKEQYRTYIMHLFKELCEFINEKNKDVNINIRLQVEKYLKENLVNPSLTRSDVAEEVGLSDSYFGKVFKEQFGINFLNYINNERIKMAAQLLEEENIPVTTIGLRVGYESESTFRRLFKKYMGVTPSQYKKTKTHDL